MMLQATKSTLFCFLVANIMCVFFSDLVPYVLLGVFGLGGYYPLNTAKLCDIGPRGLLKKIEPH